MLWAQEGKASDQKGHVAVIVAAPQAEHEMVHLHNSATPPGPLQNGAGTHAEAASKGLSPVSGQRANGAAEAPKVAHGMTLPFTPLSLTFHKMNYFVPLPKVEQPSV